MLALGLTSGCTRPAPAPVADAGPVQATLSTNRVHVGDPVDLQLTIRHPVPMTVDWPPLGQGKQLVVRDQTFEQPSPTSAVARWSLTSFALGQHAVWSGTVALVLGDGTRLEQALPALTLNVESILPEAGEQVRGPKGLVSWPRAPLTRLLWVLGLIGLLALLVGLAVRWWMRRRARPLPPPVPVPAHLRALQALAELESRTDFATADAELFFVDLSTIVRHYLEDRFDLRAPEQTTEEFIRAASASTVLRLEHKQLVESFLVECDLVKFARHRPGSDRMQQALAAAYRLVRETVPAPPRPGGAS